MSAAWADKLERRFGFIAIPGIGAFLAGMNAVVGVLNVLKPEFPSQLVLDPFLVRQGQIWRLATYLFVPPDVSPLWLFLWLILFYSYLRMLENSWGDFKLTLFCLIGGAGTALASLALGEPLPNMAFNTSLFLAFARLYPEFQILLFFFLPVKMKWLAAVTWCLTGWNLLFGGLAVKLAILAGLANYFLFFGPEHWQDLRFWWRRNRYRGRF